MSGSGDQDWVIRSAARQTQSREIENPHIAKDILLGLVDDDEWRVRISAINALATIKQFDERITEKIASQLHHSRKEVKANATIALIRLGITTDVTREQVSDLMKLTDENTHSLLIEALADLISREGKWLAVLTQFLNDPNPKGGAATIITLGKSGKYSAEVVTSLTMLLSNSTYVKEYKTTMQQLSYEALINSLGIRLLGDQ